MARLLIKKVNRYNAFEQKSYQDMLILHKPSPTHIYNQVLLVELKNKENTDHD